MGRPQRLSIALRLIGGIAVAAGTNDLLRGLDRVLGNPVGTPWTQSDGSSTAPWTNIDSELRFGSAWYVAAGALMLRAARAPERERATLQVVSAGWLLAAAGRVLSIRRLGRPHPFYLALMAAEFAIPAVLLPWQHVVERRAASQ